MKCQEVFDSFKKLNVLVVGDVMLDQYWLGDVKRISPEAPVPVLELGREERRLGGAANVALNVVAMGAGCVLCGVIGDDQAGRELLSMLPDKGISSAGLHVLPDKITTVKTRVLAASQQLLRIDREQTDELSAGEEAAFLQMIFSTMEKQQFDVVILQDYNKGVLTPKVIRSIIEQAEKRQLPVAVDPKKKNFWEYAGAKLFKPNLKELSEALSEKVECTPSALRQASRQLKDRLGNCTAIVTLSEHGLFLEDTAPGHIYPTRPRKVADVCGAGDTVISLASLGLALKLPGHQIALLCNLAGGQVVEKPGVTTVVADQLLEEAAASWTEQLL
jgi:rfaE bifunctional protein kinase chain/domain